MPIPQGYRNIDQKLVDKYELIKQIIMEGNNINFKEQIFAIRKIITE